MASASSSYFVRTGPTTYLATEHTSGAWNVAEQHIALPIGLMAHILETNFAARRDDHLLLARMSVDILGVIPVEEMSYEVTVLRPGRTIELVQVTLFHEGRAAATMRGWFLQESDTTALAGTAAAPIPPVSEHSEWDPSQEWPGGALADLRCRRLLAEPGRGSFWLTNSVPLVDDAEVGPVARTAMLFDFANGMATRANPNEVFFPNLDLTAHITRTPAPGWLGFDTTVTFDSNGVGLTHSILHDVNGPLGSLSQILTVRPNAGS